MLMICKADVAGNHAHVSSYLTTAAELDEERNNFHSRKTLLREGERIQPTQSNQIPRK